MNQCFKECMQTGQDLTSVSQSDIVWLKLSEKVGRDFLVIDPQRYQEIVKLNFDFKMHSSKALFLKFAVECFDLCRADMGAVEPHHSQMWFAAVKAVHFFQTHLVDPKVKVDFRMLKSMITDINRAFLLYCCSMVNHCLQRHSKLQNMEKMILHWATIAVADCVHVIAASDSHYH